MLLTYLNHGKLYSFFIFFDVDNTCHISAITFHFKSFCLCYCFSTFTTLTNYGKKVMTQRYNYSYQDCCVFAGTINIVGSQTLLKINAILIVL